jgi:hypothetical protein
MRRFIICDNVQESGLGLVPPGPAAPDRSLADEAEKSENKH